MALVVRTNAVSVFAQNRLGKNTDALSKTFERLSTGARINRAADDAAGMAISTLFQHRIKGQSAAKQNAQEGISLIQTAEGGVEQVRSMLDRMRELAVRASSETLNDTDRLNANLEFTQLHDEITRIAESTTFNGAQLLAGTKTLTFQVGFVNDATNRIVATMQGGMSALTLGVSIRISSAGAAQTALAAISGALDTVNAFRSKLGSIQNRLERSISNLESDIENSVASNSRIRDVDFASETSRMTRLQILTQSGTSVLSQANSAPQAALALLG